MGRDTGPSVAHIEDLFLSLLRSTSVFFRALFVPGSLKPLTFRNSIARAWLGIIFATLGSLFYSEPRNHSELLIEENGFEGYVVPSTDLSNIQACDAVVIFAHGGGMISGHPLQYLKTYRRWAAKARSTGTKMVFVAVKYRELTVMVGLQSFGNSMCEGKALSASHKWPSQRDSMLAAYRWVLQTGVSPRQVVFAGDSAGGNLVMLTLLYIRDHGKSCGLSLPNCAVLISPWFDMTGARTIGSPNVRNDILLEYDAVVPILNDALKPSDLPPDTPEISSLLTHDVSGLPPQLLIHGSTEILASDSKRWYERCIKADTKVTEIAMEGEMHTFAMGWPICSLGIQAKSDEIICKFIFDSVSHGRDTPD